ncbi:MAG TPA: acyl carrier protein [Longilinea sp.]|nr:acyl carrier protein [Longilinea sp.]
MSDPIFDQVKAVIVDVLKVDPKEVKEDTRFVEDLKADSMDLFFMVDGLCEKFEITISDEEAQKIRSVSEAVSFIKSKK